MEPVIYGLLIDSNLEDRKAPAAQRGASREAETNPNFKEKSLQTQRCSSERKSISDRLYIDLENAGWR